MSLLDKLKDAGKWAVPVFNTPNLEQQLAAAKAYEPVKALLARADSKEAYDSLEARLRQHIEGINYDTRNLYRFAKIVDTYDKLLVPVDVVADYMKIMGGIGYGLSAGKELAEAPVKLAYNAYYLGKTKDLRGFLYNLVYEGLSVFLPGSLLDLTNHYLKQAEKYTVKNAVQRFVDEVKTGAAPIHDFAAAKANQTSGLEKTVAKAA